MPLRAHEPLSREPPGGIQSLLNYLGRSPKHGVLYLLYMFRYHNHRHDVPAYGPCRSSGIAASVVESVRTAVVAGVISMQVLKQRVISQAIPYTTNSRLSQRMSQSASRNHATMVHACAVRMAWIYLLHMYAHTYSVIHTKTNKTENPTETRSSLIGIFSLKQKTNKTRFTNVGNVVQIAKSRSAPGLARPVSEVARPRDLAKGMALLSGDEQSVARQSAGPVFPG